MTAPDHVLNEFVEAWNTGRRPRVLDFLERVPAGPQRDELAELLTTWLELAPTPDYDAAARAEIRAQPAVRAVLDRAHELGAWPALLPQLRERRGLDVRALAGRLVDGLGLRAEDQERAAGYLGRLESGELEPARVSRRLLDTLGRVLGVDAEALGAAGGLRRSAAAGGVLYRGEASEAYDVEAISRAAYEPHPDDLDELDRLFTGGPD